MRDVTISFKGGAQLQRELTRIRLQSTNASSVRVGFLEGATYPGNDKGARLANASKRLTSQQKIDHPDWKPRLDSWAAWQATNDPKRTVAQVAFWNEFGTATAPARPFFRTMVARESPKWGGALARIAKEKNFNAAASLRTMGRAIQGQLRQSINTWPADNADLTVHIKQFNSGLRDTAVMLRAVDFEVMP